MTSGIVVIGEAPGKDEDREREPFVGMSGRLLNELLKHIGFAREQVYITNLLKYRPPNNRDPEVEELPANIALMKMELDILSPRVVVTMGRFAAQVFFPAPHMKSLAGIVHIKRDTYIVPMYHPAYCLRGGCSMSEMRAHISAVRDALKKPTPTELRFSHPA